MTIIYQPNVGFNLRDELEGGIVGGLFAALVDFISGTNKPWTYYLGVGLGTMAVATGIPGATATLYFIGDTVDAVLFKSPDGSNVRFFLNGIAHTTVDTYAAASIWEAINITGAIGGQVNRLDIVNYGASDNPDATGVMWMGLGPVTINGDNARAIGASQMTAIVGRYQDSESDTDLASLAITVPSGKTLVQYQSFSDAFFGAAGADAVSGSKLAEVSLTYSLTLPTGIKTDPAAGILNERGGLITFDTSGPRKDSIWIPGMNTDIMSGDAFSITQADVAAFIALLTTTHSGSTIQPTTVNLFNWVTARKGRKAFRK